MVSRRTGVQKRRKRMSQTSSKSALRILKTLSEAPGWPTSWPERKCRLKK
jgi:hypothetical protein